jgi:hypothetical protein
VHTFFVLARIEIEVFLVALALIVGFQLLTRRINTKGLLIEKLASGIDGFSPARLQMLLMTIAGAFYLISGVTVNIQQGQLNFPELDNRLFLLLGGSHALYLGGKLNSLFGLFGKSNSTPNSPKGDQS